MWRLNLGSKIEISGTKLQLFDTFEKWFRIFISFLIHYWILINDIRNGLKNSKLPKCKVLLQLNFRTKIRLLGSSDSSLFIPSKTCTCLRWKYGKKSLLGKDPIHCESRIKSSWTSESCLLLSNAYCVLDISLTFGIKQHHICKRSLVYWTRKG